MSQDTYLAALKMLARRELSEAQVRQRLARQEHDPAAIDAAIARLKAEGSLDDERTAEAIARAEIAGKQRGRHRVVRRIEAAGISSAIARQVVNREFSTVDVDALLAEALARRLRGRSHIADERELQRLYRYLLAQGFDQDSVMSLLRGRSG